MKKILTAFAALLIGIPSFCCTSMIISSKATSDGRPVMLKHRDTDELNNRIERFKGEKYDFIGLVNSPKNLNEVWSGTNISGFCIMNTATYDLKNDDIPDSQMDREGAVMYKALSLCKTVDDFEKLLSDLPKPLGVEANFGVIDAFGGAAYFEVNNYTWVKFDVNEIPCGYRVVTNFTQTGRVEDRKGVDRYEVASAFMKEADVATLGHSDLFNKVSRAGKPVLRDITSASIVFEGVKPGENPEYTVMWTLLGYPATSTYYPLLAAKEDVIPSVFKKKFGRMNAEICDTALYLKEEGISPDFSGMEKNTDSIFTALHKAWREGKITDSKFYSSYRKLSDSFLKDYKIIIADLSKNH